MALPIRPNNPNQPIPNQPFYAPLNPYVNGPYFPVDLGAGIDMTSAATVPSLVNDVAGVLIAGDGIAIATLGTDSTITNIGVTSLVAGPNITLSAASGVVTISAAGGPGGSVTSVGTGVGLTGGPITTSGTISLATSGVAAGSYTNPNITVDAYGRITVATSGTAPLTGLTGTVPVVIGGSAPTPNISVNAASTVAPGVVQLNDTVTSTLTTQAATANAVKTAYDAAVASVQSVTGTAPISSTGGTTPVISLANTAVTPGTYNYATITVDAQGRLTAASSGSAPSGGTVTSITAGTGLNGGTITTSGTINLANTAVTAGSYTNGSFTVDAQGRLTAASSGTAPVTAVTGTAPIAVTAGTTPAVSIAAASTTAAGAVQLNDTTSSTSTTLALTANQGKNLQDQINALAITSNLTLAGTIDGSTGNLVTVTTEGTAAGFTVASPLPAAASGNAEFFVIVTTAGTMTPPGGTSTVTHVGDWFLSSGTAWDFLDVGPAIPAASTTTAGIVELATDAETQTGTDATRAVTPASAAATYVPLADYTTKGDILAASGASTPVALPVGTNGQVLYANSACASGLEWGTQPITCLDFDTKGDLLAGAGSDSFATLGVGADGQILYACSTAPTGLCWTAPPAAAGNATPTVAGIVFGCTTTVATTGNTAIGNCALTANTTSDSNTAVGANALAAMSDGGANVAIGSGALSCSVSDTYNVAVGLLAMECTNGGSDNTAIGKLALNTNATGSYNVAVGSASLIFAGAESHNAAVGYQTLSSGTAGGCNTAMGNCALRQASGDFNVALGYQAACSSSTGSRNVIIGPAVQIPVVGSSCQLAIGFDAGQYWLTGDSTKAVKPGAGIIDCAGSCGTAGQVLSSDGANALEWITPSSGGSPATPTAEGMVLGCTTLDNASIGCNSLVNVDLACFSTRNVAMGVNAGCAIVEGWCNVAIGSCSMSATPVAGCIFTDNTAVGACSLGLAEGVTRNTAMGASALGDATVGSCNTALGASALRRTTTGDDNTAIGCGAMQCNTTGFCNLAAGTQAMRFNTAGEFNTVMGVCSLYSLTSGCYNVTLGYNTGCALTSSNYNVLIGPNVTVPVAGDCQLAIGFSATDNWLTGDSTKAIKPGAGVIDCTGSCGFATQFLTTTGANDVVWAVVPDATPTTTGLVYGMYQYLDNGPYAVCGNVGFGPDALGSIVAGGNTNSARNTAVGIKALANAGQAGDFSYDNVAIGLCAAACSTGGGRNVIIGSNAAPSPGSVNVVVGAYAGNLMNGATANVVVGSYSACSLTSGSDNTVNGYYAMAKATTACQNTFLGNYVGWCTVTGCGNMFMGYCAGYSNTANYNTYIGHGAALTNTSGTNNIVIGAGTSSSSPTVSDEITLGNSSITCIRANVQTISSLSDARDKKNATALPVGLNFVRELNPVAFTWEQRDGCRVGVPDTGFLAQELDAAQCAVGYEIPGLVNKDNPDRYEASYGKLLPVLVKAIQELNDELTTLKQDFDDYRSTHP